MTAHPPNPDVASDLAPEEGAGRKVRPPSRVRWPWRISLRLALLLAAVLLGYGMYFDEIRNYGLRRFGLGWVLELPLTLEPEGYGASLLVDAEVDDEGLFIPRPDVVEALSKYLAANDCSFVWLSPARRVICASPDLPYLRGEEYPQHLNAEEDFLIPGTEQEFLRANHAEIQVAGEAAGIFVLADRMEPFNPDASYPAGFIPPLRYVRTEGSEELLKLNAEIKRAQSLIATSIAACVALFLGLAISRSVTRRLSRLAREVAAPAPAGELPGPFDEGGSDEITALARALNSMRERVSELVQGLAERDNERRQWVAQVSHDLRTPLTALMACLDRAQNTLDRASEEELRERMRELLLVAQMDADRVRALSDDLLDIARLEAGDELHCEPVPPGELLRQSVMTLGPLAEGRDIDLQLSITPGLPILSADGRRLMRALENILRNAIQHARREVRVIARAVGAELEFEVRDDGQGLPVEGEQVDFEALSAYRSRADSAGLGLKVTRAVAEAHGGVVFARNLAAGGAAVGFKLPLPASA